jgi:hypothetical protein
MNENQWADAIKDAHDAATEAFAYCIANDEYIDSGACQDAGHEWAHGCAWVIYTDASRGLWMDSQYVRSMEADACEGSWRSPRMMDTDANIDERIRLCVYYALRTQFEKAWDSARLAHDESEAAE